MRFGGKTFEAAYRDYRVEQSLGEIRNWGASAVLVYVCLGIVEWFVISTELGVPYIVRYAVGLPLLLAAFLAVHPRQDVVEHRCRRRTPASIGSNTSCVWSVPNSGRKEPRSLRSAASHAA